jgi:glycerophosphoryl diester phosphodiesterase
MTLATQWSERRVLCYAHQGGSREGPSSTLWAMERALAAGTDAIELDVHATADGHLVVCHDPTVDRTTDGRGSISAMTLAELRQLDNAYWWVPGSVVAPGRPAEEYALRGRAPADRGLGIATLDEVLEAFPQLILNLDIKQTAPVVAPYEEALARSLNDHGRRDDVIVASFNDASTAAFRVFAPEIATSAGTLGVAEFWRAVHAGETIPSVPFVALQIPVTTAGVTVCVEPLVEAAHRAGLAVHVWTVDDADEMARLIDLGVDGIITDVPSVAVSVLNGRAARWARGG